MTDKCWMRLWTTKHFRNKVLDHMAIMGRYRSQQHFLQEACEEKIEREKDEAEKMKLAQAHTGLFKLTPQGVKKTHQDIMRKRSELENGKNN